MMSSTYARVRTRWVGRAGLSLVRALTTMVWSPLGAQRAVDLTQVAPRQGGWVLNTPSVTTLQA